MAQCKKCKKEVGCSCKLKDGLCIKCRNTKQPVESIKITTNVKTDKL